MTTLAVRFVVELLGVAAIGYWGFTAVTGSPWGLVAGIGAPLLLIVAWALVVAPNADNPLAPRTRQIIGTMILLVVTGALAAAGQPGAAALYGSVIIGNQVLLVILEPDVALATGRLAGPRA